MPVWPLGWEDPLEEGMATHSSILTWRIQWTEEPGGLWSMGSQRVRHDLAHNSTEYEGESNLHISLRQKDPTVKKNDYIIQRLSLSLHCLHQHFRLIGDFVC